MKIVYLHQYFNTPNMAGGTRSYEMATRLVAQGHEVYMVTSDRGSSSARSGWREETIDGIRVFWYRVPYSNHFGFIRRVRAFASFALAARRKAASFQVDLVFATSTPLTIAIPGVHAARRLNAPMVFEVRDLWPELPVAIGALKNPLLIWLARKLERYAYRHAARVIALSPGMADGVAACGYPREKITVVPNNCNIERFAAATGNLLTDRIPALKGRKIVLYAGTFGRINGVAYLVDVAEQARTLDPNLAFVMVGEGLEKQKVIAAASRLGLLGNNVWVLDSITKHEVPDYFAAATLCCSLFVDLPEMWRNSANKFFDALAAGKPVVINYQGWQKTLLEESGAGLVLPATDPRGAADMIVNLLADPDALGHMGAAAAELARSQFATDHVFVDFLATLEAARQEHS